MTGRLLAYYWKTPTGEQLETNWTPTEDQLETNWTFRLTHFVNYDNS
jgi:hypothetical protein